MNENRTTEIKEISPTSLDACLCRIAKILGRPTPQATLLQTQRGQDKNLRVRDVISISQKLGIDAAFGKVELFEIAPRVLPLIIFLDEGRAIVVERIQEEGQFTVYDPALPEATCILSIGQLKASYSGFAIIFRAQSIRKPEEVREVEGHWFWSNLLEHKWTYLQVIIAALMINVLAVAISAFVMIVYDRILPNEAVESLMALTAGVIIALIFDFMIKTLRAMFLDRAGQVADKKMSRLIFEQLLDVQLKARRGSTGFFANTLREFETLREFFTSATLTALVDLPFIFVFLAVIYMIGGSLALVPAIAVPTVLLIGVSIQPVLARLSERTFKEGQQKQSVLVETVSGLEAVKCVGAGRELSDRWEDAVERQADFSVRSRLISQSVLNAAMFVQQAAQVVIVFFGVFMTIDGSISMGALIASVMLTGRALAPLGQFAQTLTRLHGARVSYSSINNFMVADCEHPNEKTWLERSKLSGKIGFEDVHFSYPGSGGLAALSGVSFTINPGERVAILGRAGCGKSTITRLILGLYEPTSGSVLLDDTDLRQINPDDIRRNVGAVLQDVWLLSGTIRTNIAMGAIRPSDTEILNAAKLAGVDDFVARHRAGYDLMLGERGDGLSGGQKQAITIARAIVGRPPIFLFDEPTSAMDMQSEARLIERLNQSLSDETLVIITHRTSLLTLVDRVIVIDQGRVIADGPKSIIKVGNVPLKAGAA